MEMLEEMRQMLQEQNQKIESMYRENQELREKVSCLTADISRFGGYLQQSPAPRMLSDQSCIVPLRLQFVNSCNNDKYSTRKIEADDETPLKVAIYDHNNKIITSEPFSSMRVQIVAIHGNFDDDHKGQWSEEYFRSKIVTGRPGKEHLLSGKLYFRLQGGVGYLNSSKFQDNSSFVPSKRFKLGVMAADERISERIQEGITESFAVKDVWGYSTKKNPNPSPRDAVYKLTKIAMNGDRHKVLELNDIKTVEDFLCFYRKSPEELRKILGKISDQDWDMIINHAHKCNPRPGIYSSCVQERNMSHEHEASFSSGSYYLQGSCSMQPSPTSQRQPGLQVAEQQKFSIYNGLSSGASSDNMPSEHEGIQVACQQVSSRGKEVMSVLSMGNNNLEGSSSQQRHSLEFNIAPEHDVNGLSHVNPSVENAAVNNLELLVNSMLYDDKSWADLLQNLEEDAFSGKQEIVGYEGCSPASEAGSISYGGISPSPVSEAGSRSYRGISASPVSEAGSRSYRGISPSPVRGGGFTRRGVLPRGYGRLSPSPARGARSLSIASTDFTDEEECSPFFTPNIF